MSVLTRTLTGDSSATFTSLTVSDPNSTSDAVIEDLDLTGTLQLGSVIISSFSTDGTLASNSDAIFSTQKAIKTYVDTTSSLMVTSAALFGTDNVILRSDGTSRGAQASGISIDDSDNIITVGTINSGAITATSVNGLELFFDATDNVVVTNAGLTAPVNSVRCTVFGQEAMKNVTTATDCVVFGANAGWSLTDKNDCVIIGSSADSSASQATIIGYNASNVGQYFTGLGENVGKGGRGVDGVCVGRRAGYTNMKDYCVLLGATSNSAYSECVVIGRSGASTKADQIMLGGPNQTSLTVPFYTTAGILQNDASGEITSITREYGGYHWNGTGLTLNNRGAEETLLMFTSPGVSSNNTSGIALEVGSEETISSLAGDGVNVVFTMAGATSMLAGDPISVVGTTSFDGFYVIQSVSGSTITCLSSTTASETITAYIQEGTRLTITNAGDYKVSVNASYYCTVAATGIELRVIYSDGSTTITPQTHTTVTDYAATVNEIYTISLVGVIACAANSDICLDWKVNTLANLSMESGQMVVERLSS